MTVVAYSICVLVSFTLAVGAEGGSDEIKEVIKASFHPLVALALLALLMIFCLRHKNELFWLIISLSILAQYILAHTSVPDEWVLTPMFLVILTVDLKYVYISFEKETHRFLEFPPQEKRDVPDDQFFSGARSVGAQSRGGSMSSAFRNKHISHLSQIGYFRTENPKTKKFFKCFLIFSSSVGFWFTVAILLLSVDSPA